MWYQEANKKWIYSPIKPKISQYCMTVSAIFLTYWTLRQLQDLQDFPGPPCRLSLSGLKSSPSLSGPCALLRPPFLPDFHHPHHPHLMQLQLCLFRRRCWLVAYHTRWADDDRTVMSPKTERPCIISRLHLLQPAWFFSSLPEIWTAVQAAWGEELWLVGNDRQILNADS